MIWAFCELSALVQPLMEVHPKSTAAKPDWTFRNFRASNSDGWQIVFSSESSIGGFWSSEIMEGTVGKRGASVAWMDQASDLSRTWTIVSKASVGPCNLSLIFASFPIVFFCRLLQMQAAYDIAYLFCNVPAFILPILVSKDLNFYLILIQPVMLPLIHIFLMGRLKTNSWASHLFSRTSFADWTFKFLEPRNPPIDENAIGVFGGS